MTQQLILDAAIALLEEGSLAAVTARALAKRAGISERTVFRYFSTRDQLLDAIAEEMVGRLALPPPPQTTDELLALPRALYSRCEERPSLTRAALHSELFPRIRDSAGKARWDAIRKVVAAWAPRQPAPTREIAAVNIRFFLSAMTWNYYRAYFGLSLEETIACAETAIQQSLDALR
jgi:AcrR family transcriptional regulator